MSSYDQRYDNPQSLGGNAKSYVHHVHKLSEFCGRFPNRLGAEDVRAYQLSLVERGGLGSPEPGRLRTALFLWCHPGADRSAGKDRVCPPASPTARRAERCRGGELPGGHGGDEEPGRSAVCL